jgi:hypothetical protein
MIFIAHRANLEGKDLSRENHPDAIIDCIEKGFDVEIDVRRIKNEWVLGHDEPQYKIDFSFLQLPGLWVHAKNVETFTSLIDHYEINSFFHNTDDVVLTTRGWLWTYPGKPLLHYFSVAVMPEIIDNWSLSKAKAICTDYPIKYKALFGGNNDH